MTTATATRPTDTAALPAAALPAEQHVVLSPVSWATYKAIGDLLQDHNVRLNYSRGALEIMTVSPRHERYKHLLVLLIAVLAEELDIDVAGFGSMTFQREVLDRGMEPDECYWIAHEAAVRGRRVIDLASDPPPDLVLEIEVSRNLVARLPILAAFRVPEVWRCREGTLQMLLLQADGQYAAAERSLAFPFLPLADFARFLNPDAAESETKLLRAFRAWVRQEAGNWRGPAQA